MADNDPFDKNQKLQSTTATGHPPAKRITNADAAWAIYQNMKTDTEKLAIQRAKIKAQQDGLAPFSRQERKRHGLEWMANVNFRRARGTVRKNNTSVWNMFVSVPQMLNLSLKDKSDQDPQEPSTDYGSIISQHFTDTILDWEDYYYNQMLRIQEMHVYGNGPALWPNETTWKSQVIKAANILVPSKARSKKTGFRVICVRDEMEITDVFDRISNEEAAREKGWNIEATRKAIVKAYKEGQKGDYTDDFGTSEWESVYQRIANNDDMIDLQFDGLKVVHMLVEEAKTKKITHLILHEADSYTGPQDKNRQFLFEKQERFDRMSQVIQFMLYDIGDGLLKSVHGLAYDLHPSDDISNRLTCHVLDAVTMTSGIMLQSQAGEDQAKAPLMRKGPVTMISPGYNAIQSSFSPPLDKAISALRLMYSIQNNVGGVYQEQAEAAEASRQPRTATAVTQEASEEARHETNQAAWYYVQHEAWLKETFRRLMAKTYPEDEDGYEEWKQFRDHCKNDGVPDSLMDYDKWRVKASRAVGMGSEYMARVATQWLLGISPMFDERGRTNAIRDAIQARFPTDKVDRYAPLQNRDRIATSEHTIANLENNDFAEGATSIVGVDQPHVIHLLIHFSKAQEYLEAYKTNPQAVNLPVTVQFLQLMLPHTGRHIQLLARDPTRKAKADEFMQIQNGVQQAAQTIFKDYEQMVEAQRKQREQERAIVEEAQRREPELKAQVELEKVKSQERIERMKAEGLNETRIQKMEAGIMAKVQGMIADVQRKATESAAERARKDAESMARIAREDREAAAKGARGTKTGE